MPARIGTAEHGGTFYTQGLALKAVLDRAAPLAPVAILETPGASVGNAVRLADGDIDFGFMAANWTPRAARGEHPFSAPIDLRVVAPMNDGPLFFIARADSSLRAIADLAGRRVVVGLERSGMAQHADAMLGALGIAVRPVHLDFAAGAAALEAGAADAQLQCPVPNPVMTALSERAALRVLPYGAGQLERVLAAVPHYRRTVMGRGTIRGLADDTAQVAVLNLLVTHARQPAETAAAAARAIATHAAALGASNALFRGLGALFAALRMTGAAALGNSGVALHPGAARAYRDLGLLA